MSGANASRWWLVGAVLVVVCMFGALAMSGQQAPQSDSIYWRLAEPIRHENLSIFPVIGKQSANTSGFATLDEALSAGEVVVTESGGDAMRRSTDGRPIGIAGRGASVNQLVLINRGPRALMLLAGELVSGGKQDRVISKDRIVPPGAAPLPLDVFCVEQGRWSSGTQFSAGQLIVHPSVREKATVDQEQDKVWAAVRRGTTANSGLGGGVAAPPAQARLSESVLGGALSAEAPTQSYARLYKSSRVGSAVEPFLVEVEKRFARRMAELRGERVVGVVVAYGGDVAWSDIFASPALFERYRPKLLRSYVVEALARPQTKEQASMDDARVFLKPLSGRENIETEPGVYSLKQVTQGRHVEIELEAQRPSKVTLHTVKIHRTS